MSGESLKKVISLVDKAIEGLISSDFESAKQYIDDGINASDCSICQLELKILEADIDHNQKMCVLGADTCKEELIALIDKAKELKKDFIDAENLT